MARLAQLAERPAFKIAETGKSRVQASQRALFCTRMRSTK